MRRLRFARERFADYKKEKPRHENARGTLRDANRHDKTASLSQRHARQLFQASGAEHTIVMFGDAFAAKELLAFRAACHRFAGGVIEATLIRERRHAQLQFGIPGGAFGSWITNTSGVPGGGMTGSAP
jgi:hypothetical protein